MTPLFSVPGAKVGRAYSDDIIDNVCGVNIENIACGVNIANII